MAKINEIKNIDDPANLNAEKLFQKPEPNEPEVETNIIHYVGIGLQAFIITAIVIIAWQNRVFLLFWLLSLIGG